MIANNDVKGWILKCTVCNNIWVLEVSFDIRNVKTLYHFCYKCKRNTFHEVLGRTENKFKD
jgi:hypothetical protein